MLAAYNQGSLPFYKVTASVQGWTNHVRYANSMGLRKAMLSTLII